MTPRTPQKISRQPILLATLFMLLFPVVVFACKYSVRDVGFVTLDNKYYELRLIVSEAVMNSEQEQIEQQLGSLLRDTNMLVTLLAVNSEEVTEAERNQFELSKQTVAFLGDRFSTESTTSENSFRELFLQAVDLSDFKAVSDMVWGLSQSTLREQILDSSLKAHSVLLIVEGANAEANQKAWSLAQKSSEQVKETLADLPKLIEHPPQLLKVTREARQQERLLLWSLGCQLDQETTYVLPLFGRGRLLGEPLLVPGLSSTELSTILGYVGQDCECELDRSWMQGKMFPHHWEEDIQEQAAKTLGFDPGNPLVMTEISRILARGPNGRRNLQVGQVGESDLIDLSNDTNEEVSKETADDILRELNLLPEETEPTESNTEVAQENSDLSEEDPTITLTQTTNQPQSGPSENDLVETSFPPIPIGNDTNIHNVYISQNLIVVLEILVAAFVIGLGWVFLRSRR